MADPKPESERTTVPWTEFKQELAADDISQAVAERLGWRIEKGDTATLWLLRAEGKFYAWRAATWTEIKAWNALLSAESRILALTQEREQLRRDLKFIKTAARDPAS